MKEQSKHSRKMAMAAAVPLLVMAMLIVVSIGGRRAHGAAPMTFTVTNTNDSGEGSLRQAIQDANAGVGTINFEPGVTGVITLTTGELPQIFGVLDINGPGATSLTVSGNNASRVFNIAGGATVTISGLTISNGNAGSDLEGGGVLNDGGTLTITNCTVSGNSSSAGGAGIANTGTLAISNCTVSDNSGGSGAGIANVGTLTISNSTVSGNSSGPQAHCGGGISNNSPGTLTISNSTVSGNSIHYIGGVGVGGGICNDNAPLTISNSTVSGNSADEGGAIWNADVLTIGNSTVSGNSAGAGGGGGIINAGTLTISNSTLSDNSTTGLGGGIFNTSTLATVNIKNSIVANGMSGGNCANPANGPFNVFGTNFSTDGTCTGFNTSGPLNLLPLALNAPGTTATHALAFGSVAIDAVTDCTDLSDPPRPVTTDQRGVPRPQAARCDVGAYEAVFLYNFAGFFQPVANPPTVNVAKAGASIAVNFSLGGDQGLNIFAAGSPASQQIECNGGAPVQDIEETVTAGHSSLSYDPTLDQYAYVWKTDKAWKGTCRLLIVTLKDGTVHTANFQFK